MRPDDPLSDREPETSPGFRAARLQPVEGLEYAGPLVGRDSGSVVGHLQAELVSRARGSHLDRVSWSAMAEGVVDKDHQDLTKPVSVHPRVDLASRHELDPGTPTGGQCFQVSTGRGDELGDVCRLELNLSLPRINPGESEEVIDEAGHPSCLGRHRLQHVTVVAEVLLRMPAKDLETGVNDRQGGPQLVGRVSREANLPIHGRADRDEGSLGEKPAGHNDREQGRQTGGEGHQDRFALDRSHRDQASAGLQHTGGLAIVEKYARRDEGRLVGLKVHLGG